MESVHCTTHLTTTVSYNRTLSDQNHNSNEQDFVPKQTSMSADSWQGFFCFAICGEKSHCIVYPHSHYTADNTGFISLLKRFIGLLNTDYILLYSFFSIMYILLHSS